MAQTILIPTGDGSTGGWTATSGELWDEIAEDPDAPDQVGIQGPNVSDGSYFCLLSDVPGDFNPSGVTSITVRVLAGKSLLAVMAEDTIDLFAQLFRADESTGMTTESTVMTLSLNELHERSLTISGTHTVTDWNGARLRLRQDHTSQQTPDTICQAVVYAVEVVVDYNTTTAALKDLIGCGIIPYAR